MGEENTNPNEESTQEPAPQPDSGDSEVDGSDDAALTEENE